MDTKIKTAPTSVPTGISNLDISALRKRRDLANAMATVLAATPPLQALFMFDLTASTFKYFDLIRKKIPEIHSFVSKEAQGSQFSVSAFRNHGDEILHGQIHYTSPFNSDPLAIQNIIGSIRKGGGGTDSLTCMEECLSDANKLPWAANSPKALVIFGDMPPHGVLDDKSNCPNGIDYAAELEKLISKGIYIFPVFCGRHEKVRNFYKSLAEKSGGKFIEIKDLDILADLLKGICLKALGKIDAFIGHLRQTKPLPKNKELLLLELLQ